MTPGSVAEMTGHSSIRAISYPVRRSEISHGGAFCQKLRIAEDLKLDTVVLAIPPQHLSQYVSAFVKGLGIAVSVHRQFKRGEGETLLGSIFSMPRRPLERATLLKMCHRADTLKSDESVNLFNGFCCIDWYCGLFDHYLRALGQHCNHPGCSFPVCEVCCPSCSHSSCFCGCVDAAEPRKSWACMSVPDILKTDGQSISYHFQQEGSQQG